MKSLAIPFNVTGGHIADTTNPIKIVEQKIVNVLVTGNGERITLPLYGAGVQQLLFAPLDRLTEVDFKTDATAELQGNISNVAIAQITIDEIGPTEARLTVYYRTPLSTIQSATLTIALPGSLDEETPI